LKKKNLLIIFFIIIFNVTFTNTEKKESYIIASFNTLHLGWKGKDYKELAEIISLFDLVGLQEVMSKDGLKKLDSELEKLTNEKWYWHISKYSVGRSKRYREYYAYIWREKKVKFKRSMGFFKEKNDEFIREPYGAIFQIKDLEFGFVLNHFIYGEKKKDRQLEALYLDEVYNYFNKFTKKILIAGDFNLPAYDESFKDMIKNKIFYAIDPTNKTTIGKYGLASSYDNFFIPYDTFDEYSGRNGVYDFTKDKKYDKKYGKEKYKVLRETVSDHLPVFIELDI
jgi:endonuclease/exonuclease/phosphatase family metal-dependent hydrolase